MAIADDIGLCLCQWQLDMEGGTDIHIRGDSELPFVLFRDDEV